MNDLVLVTSRSFSTGSVDAESRLTASGFQVERGAIDHDTAALRPLLENSVAWIAGTSPVTSSHLSLAPRLRVIARYGVGVDAVDVHSAQERGLIVTNTPTANASAVADHTLALMLTLLRGSVRGDRAVRSGDWSAWRTRELSSLTVGILGFGRIGHAVALRLRGFDARVLASDPYVDGDVVRRFGVEPVDESGLLEASDVISLHTPGGQTVVDRSWLDRARRPLLLVNTARADLVDEDALADAMQADARIHYAADSLLHEHSCSPSRLLAREFADRVVITPHIAAQTVEAIDRMSNAAVDNVLAVLAGDDPINPVTPR